MKKNTSKIRSHEDPATRFAKLFAKLYYYMAEEMYETLGEEKGTEAIRSAMTKFGEERVRSMKEEAEERGIEVKTVEDYFAVRDMPSNGWVNDERGCKYCPFEDVWSDYGELGQKLGALYCEVDYILFNSFNLGLEREYCKTWGDDICEFKFNPGK